MSTSSNVETEYLKATPDGRLSRRQAARYLGVAERTLANWRSQGLGPKQIKIGGRVFYWLADLQDFVATPGVL